jgi:hypothetical protein
MEGSLLLTLRQIREEDIDGFRATVDAVARERKYLALLQAPRRSTCEHS